jgi:uncharacterized protein YjaZ
MDESDSWAYRRWGSMGVIRTDSWLLNDFDNAIKICEKLQPYFKGKTAKQIYNQLLNFGMYQPSRSSKDFLHKMNEQKVWDQVERLFSKYKVKWSGPDIPVFLFPLAQSRSFFIRTDRKKGGVSFPDKMFLFLSSHEDAKEIEALFVHEYHHVCRLCKMNKKMGDYTLLDSLVIEGLAEYAVLRHCGAEYLADWCHMYSEKEITYFWSKFLKKHLDFKKNERVHDELLFGGGRVPKLLGYAVGYNIIDKYYKNHNYSTKLSFEIPAAKFVEDQNS